MNRVNTTLSIRKSSISQNCSILRESLMGYDQIANNNLKDISFNADIK